ncbi:hypothetical protein ABEB36_009906 [Hypothenemus hampei]|uniref:Saccharopine dehydrogenase NADP binding domain-containing protein n=1 Tax=Hypothenemus hampei TaxID=57062 RepID=A0ABD1EHV4_HYPHA
MTHRLDIVIFGASGFTGMHCIPYIAKHSKENGRNLSWGVAGRSEEKLKSVLKEIGDKIDSNLDSIEVIVADVKDPASMLRMAKQAKLIINCVGPYRFFGESVVDACVEAGTHHIDVSGESDYMEAMQLKHYQSAKEKGVYVISGCGLECIPIDLGTVFLQQKFEGTLHSVNTYTELSRDNGSPKGPLFNYGTWDSLINVLSNLKQIQREKKRFNETFKKPPVFSPKLAFNLLPHYVKIAKGWTVPYLTADRSVARRSQSYLYENENIRPVQVGTYLIMPWLMGALMVIFGGLVLAVLSRFKLGKKLLLDYPEWFTFGLFSKKTPLTEDIENCRFTIHFYGLGWKEKTANKDEQINKPPNKAVKALVKGSNPGYGATCLFLVLTAITLLTETDKMANKGKGGVLPPGAAFAKTTLVDQLNRNGVTFEILSEEEIK